jgi:AraC-like DNA-binding protein
MQVCVRERGASRCQSRELPADGTVGWRIDQELVPPGVGIDSDDPAKDACEMSLIADQSLLSRRFRHLVGSSPKDYPRMNALAPQQHITESRAAKS